MNSFSFKICILIFAIGAVVLRWIDSTPPGIIEFELAKTIENANQMVSTWEAADVLPQKKFSILFDYLFIVGYAGSIFLILKEWFDKTGKIGVQILRYLPILAGILDAIENFGLWQIVSHNGNQFYASLAFYSASIKFLLLIPSVLGVMYFVSLKFIKKI